MGKKSKAKYKITGMTRKHRRIRINSKFQTLFSAFPWKNLMLGKMISGPSIWKLKEASLELDK